MNNNFIKIFNNEKEANIFAAIHNTQAVIYYDWDAFANRIIRQYVVKY